MMRYLRALPGSFVSRGLYRSVATEWKGAGLLYQALLIAIAALVISIRTHVGVAHFATHWAPPVLAQLPSIDIDHGVVSVNHPMPIRITEPDSGKVVLIIDTTGEITSLEGTGANFLLTRNQLIGVRSNGVIQTHDLSKIEQLHVDRKLATGWVRAIGTWFAVLCAPFVFAGLYLGRLIVMMIPATVLLLVGRSERVDFATTMRLTSVALTPATLMEIALDGVGFRKGPLWGLLWLVITAGYVAFAWSSSRPARPFAAEPETPAPEPARPSGPY